MIKHCYNEHQLYLLGEARRAIIECKDNVTQSDIRAKSMCNELANRILVVRGLWREFFNCDASEKIDIGKSTTGKAYVVIVDTIIKAKIKQVEAQCVNHTNPEIGMHTRTLEEVLTIFRELSKAINEFLALEPF